MSRSGLTTSPADTCLPAWLHVLHLTCMLTLQVDGQISATYDDFLSVVAKGRGLSREAVRQVAKGRVWSGSQAMEVRQHARW